MEAADSEAVLRIYDEGIRGGNATFASHPGDWEQFDAAHSRAHRLVAVDDVGDVVGWTAVAATSTREVYRGVVENSLYVAASAQGRGAGHCLLSALISSTEDSGVWTIIAGVFPQNHASLALHQAHGFRAVGVHTRLGRTAGGVWRDVVRSERRSAHAGVD